MKRFTILTLLLLSAAPAFAQRAPAGKVGTFRFAEEKGGHKVRLVFRTGPFDRSKHRITHGKRLDLTVLEVDGRMAFGVDDRIPHTEIRSVAFYFDGKRVVVPKSLYADCFEPSFGKEYFAIKAGDDGGSLLVFMAGGDAAGGYQVIWVLRKDGRHSRFSTPCSDCDYTGFMTFFMDQFAR
jgi:hypothetical protein